MTSRHIFKKNDNDRPTKSKPEKSKEVILDRGKVFDKDVDDKGRVPKP